MQSLGPSNGCTLYPSYKIDNVQAVPLTTRLTTHLLSLTTSTSTTAAMLTITAAALIVTAIVSRRPIYRYGRALLRRVKEQSTTIRMIVVVSAASGLAWLVGSLLGLSAPAVGAVACVLTVQTTTHLSLRTGAVRIIATAAGLGVAVVMFRYAGVDTLSVVAVVAVSMVVGYLLGLGHEGAKIVPATSLIMFALGGALTGTLVWGDMAATLLGVVIGAFASIAAQPDSALIRAQNQLSQLSSQIGSLLATLGDGTRTDYTRYQAREWLTQARNLVTVYTQAHQAVSEALAHATFTTSTARAEAKELKTSLTVLQYSIDQVTAIARALFDAVVVDTEVPDTLGNVLTATADAFVANAALESPTNTNVDPSHLDDAIDQIKSDRATSLHSLRQMDDTGMWLLSGSIIADVDRMVTQLEGNSAALTVGGGTQDDLNIQPTVLPVPPPARMVAVLASRTRPNRPTRQSG
jgi:uncharacterized membrane protein YgaE (UPF0421/DUF939 family)